MDASTTNHPTNIQSAQAAATTHSAPHRQGPHWQKRPANTNQGTSLDSVQYQLEQLSSQHASPQQITAMFVELACQLTSAIWCGLYQKNGDKPLVCIAEFNAVADQNLGLVQSSLLPTAEKAVSGVKARIAQSSELTVIAVPVFDATQAGPQASQCLCVALNLQNNRVEPFLLIIQMVASYLTRWNERDRISQLDWQIQATAAVAELMSEIANSDEPKQATILATNKMAQFLNARVVAIGLCKRDGSKMTRLASISGETQIDIGGKSAALYQTALNETLIRGSVTTLPDMAGDDRTMKLAHRQILEADPNTCLVSSPLTTSNGKTIGALICVLPSNERQHLNALRFAKVVSSFLADALDATGRANAGPLSRLVKQTRKFARGRIGRIALVSGMALALIMAVPLPHRIGCDCTLQPTVRRFAVAPHDGILLQSFVKPGGIVAPGQLIARMDDRELRLELAGLIAERETAIKKRDVNRSARDAAATQIAEFEIEQLDARISLVKFKQENLEIKSAVEGIVLQGDLDDAHGAPVRTGDVLMEIAPLEKLKLEVEVPEADVSYVEKGQKTTFVLDGNPLDVLVGEVELVRPMSEVLHNQNVFVGEVIIDNQNRLLRPGMQGRAKINEGYRSIGWQLFHRPVEKVFSTFR